MSIKKTAKRLFAAIVALVLSVAMVTPAFAESGTNTKDGTITINNAVPGETYSIYQILTLESYDTDAGAYSYKATSEWKEWLETQTSYVSIDESGYVTWVASSDDATVAAFAKLALAYAESNNISATKSEKAPAAAEEGQTTSTVTFSGLNLGWYLVDTSLGSLCSLGTTNKNATIQEKNSVPSIDKEVVDGDGNEPSVGDSVNFKITVTAQKGAQNYVVHDTMSDGLTFNDDVKVTANNTELTANVDYSVSTSVDDDCTFEVIFTETYLNTITEETNIEITYSATINEKAVVDTDPETNEAKLDYGDDSSTTSTTETKTYVYYFDLVKDDTSNKLIAGAEFKLYESETGGDAIQFVVDNGTYRVATVAEIADEETDTTDTISVTNGMVRISGLGQGNYYLEETKAPDGYNKLTDRVLVTVNKNNAATVTDTNGNELTDAGDTYVNGGVEVENKAGSLLPSTGGTGTTMLYVVGGALVVAAGVALVVRRRMSNEA